MSLVKQIESFLGPAVADLGYELLEVEFQHKSAAGGAVVRLFIDRPEPGQEPIGIDDCVAVDRGLSELIDSPEFEALVNREFTLEVSSPGVDRPLRKREHFERYAGQKGRIRTFRALNAEEMRNEAYFSNHARQKNFVGIIAGVDENAVELHVENEKIFIPLELIAKANLDIVDDLMRKQGQG